MEYRIVSAGSRSALEQQVIDLIIYGWQPQGGVAVSSDSSGGTSRFFQAMTFTPPVETTVVIRDGGAA